MALTPSTMAEIGGHAPPFTLPDVRTQQPVSSDEFSGQPLLVMFICNHCPYVRHVEYELAQIGVDYADSELAIVAISSNDAQAYPDDDPAALAAQAVRCGFRFPYLYDATQDAARAYGAACTPDFFLYDTAHELVYRGRLDGSRPGSGTEPDGADLRAAIDAVLAGKAPSAEQVPSMGCNIKWATAHR